jgi:hypothetical protein
MTEPSLSGWRAQYDRMRRSYERLKGLHWSSIAYEDDLSHYFQDCTHLKDWIRHDPSLGIGEAIEAAAGKHLPLQIAADLARGANQLRRTKRDPEGAHVTSSAVTVPPGQSRPSELQYEVILADGKVFSAEQVAQEALHAWTLVLIELKLIRMSP